MDIKLAISLVGFVAAGVLGAEARYTPAPIYYRHVAESRTGTILDLVDRARFADGDFKSVLCRTLRQEIAQLCDDSPGSAVCEDRLMYLEQAGCA